MKVGRIVKLDSKLIAEGSIFDIENLRKLEEAPNRTVGNSGPPTPSKTTKDQQSNIDITTEEKKTNYTPKQALSTKPQQPNKNPVTVYQKQVSHYCTRSGSS